MFLQRGTQERAFPLSLGGGGGANRFLSRVSVAVSKHRARERSCALSSCMWPKRLAHGAPLLSQHSGWFP